METTKLKELIGPAPSELDFESLLVLTRERRAVFSQVLAKWRERPTKPTRATKPKAQKIESKAKDFKAFEETAKTLGMSVEEAKAFFMRQQKR